MDLVEVTWQGDPVSDEAILDLLPSNLRGLLAQVNGFIQFQGGLHVRGAVAEPDWHSLRFHWEGETALYRLYPESVLETDIPFAQSAMSDQFFLRDGMVWCLPAEEREVVSKDCGLYEFLDRVQADPVGYLNLAPLVQFLEDGGVLEPGQTLNVYPPYCMKHKGPRSIRGISATEQISYLALLTEQLANVSSGTTVRFVPTN